MPLFRLSRPSLQSLLRPAAAALATALALYACGGGGDDGTAPTTGTIGGRVTAGANAVSGATINLGGPATRTATTNASGDFTFAALAPGAYTLTVGLPAGFVLAAGQVATRNATVVAGQSATVNWTATASGGGGGGGGGNVVEVRLNGTSFTPATVNIAAGTTVRWIVDGGAHTVTPDNAAQPGVWTGSGTLTTGNTFEHTFNTAGQNYDYHCIPHQGVGMTGVVRVAP